jgi:Ran GTPase-activating protein (RanGAP) involved in mRNA processing and transport
VTLFKRIVSTTVFVSQSRPGVSTLLLGDNRISSTALLLLAPQLVAQSALTELDMSHNRFTDSGFVALCQAMVDASNPPPLSHLRVAGNALGTRGTQALAEWLSSTRLKSLDMSNTVSLRPAALESVLRALAPSTASNLCYLDVSGNKLGEAQATLLAAAWRSSARSLRTARASDNNFGVSGITTLAAAIARTFVVFQMSLFSPI